MDARAFYLIVDFLIVLFAYISSDEKRKLSSKHTHIAQNKLYYKLFLFMSAVVMIGVSALRYQVGRDYISYSNAYQNIARATFFSIPPSNLANWLGPGYVVLCKVIALLAGDNYLWLHAIVAIITGCFLYSAIERNSANMPISLYLYISLCLYYSSFNQSRQGLAIVIVLYSYKHIRNRDFKRFLITMLLAISIHYSAIIFIPAYFLAKIDITIKKIALMLGTAFLITFVFDPVIMLIRLTQYGHYVDSQYFVDGSELSLFKTIYLIGLLFICLLFKNIATANNCKIVILYNFAVIATCLEIISNKGYIIGRVVTYYEVFYIFLIPEIINTFKNIKNRRIASLTIIVIYLVLHAMRANSKGYWDGYQTFLLI